MRPAQLCKRTAMANRSADHIEEAEDVRLAGAVRPDHHGRVGQVVDLEVGQGAEALDVDRLDHGGCAVTAKRLQPGRPGARSCALLRWRRPVRRYARSAGSRGRPPPASGLALAAGGT